MIKQILPPEALLPTKLLINRNALSLRPKASLPYSIRTAENSALCKLSSWESSSIGMKLLWEVKTALTCLKG